MTKSDIIQFAKTFSGICEVYGKEATKTLTEIYFNCFEKFPIERVKDALNKHTLASKFFPKPSEIMELLEGNKEEKALIAWTTFRDTIRHEGANNSIIFSDPKISWIVDTYGGWIRVCAMETKDLDFMRLGFLKAYNSIRDDVPQKKLIGMDEFENGARGFKSYIPKPKVIGNSEDIKQLTEN